MRDRFSHRPTVINKLKGMARDRPSPYGDERHGEGQALALRW